MRGLIGALFVIGLCTAFTDSLIPVFIGRVVALVERHSPETLLHDAGWQLAGMAAVMLLWRPGMLLMQSLVTNQGIAAGMTNLIRWQAHWHVVRQSWPFFQNDFAGRVANRVMQTGPALRESIVSATNSVWYIVVYGSSATVLLAGTDWRLALPMAAWFCGYVTLLRVFVPRMRRRSRDMSEVRSKLTGRIVDSYTNILTVKLFAAARDEDQFVRETVDEHTAAFHRQLRLTTTFMAVLTSMNASLVTGTAAAGILLWQAGRVPAASLAMAVPLAWQITQMAGWVAQNVTALFENVGIVQDGMRSIAVPRLHPDPLGAAELAVTRGEIRFEHVRFGYGTARGVLSDISLVVAPGERVGLGGPVGGGQVDAGEPAAGLPPAGGRADPGRWSGHRGRDPGELRRQVAVVTQDTSLLHRSMPRQHPLRPAECPGARDRGSGAAGRGTGVHRAAGGLGRPTGVRGACRRARGQAGPAASGSAWRSPG